MTDIKSIALLTAREKDRLKKNHDIETIEELADANWSDVRGSVDWSHWVSAQSSAQKILESEELSESSPDAELESLRAKRKILDRKGWESAVERIDEEIAELETQIDESEELSDAEQSEIAVLQDQLEFHEENGYDALASRTREEIEELRGDAGE